MSYWQIDVMAVMYGIAFWYLIAVLVIAAVALVLGVLTSRDEHDGRR